MPGATASLSTNSANSGRRVGLTVAILCGLVQISDGYDVSAVGMTVPALFKLWNVAPAAFANAFVLSSVGILIGALAAGPLGDRFGRKLFLVLFVAEIAALSFATVFVTSLPSLVMIRFFTGIGLGGALPLTVALTSQHAPGNRVPTYVMWMFAGNTVGGLLGGQVAALVLPNFGWQGVYAVGALLPLLLIPLLILFIPNISAERPGAAKPSLAAIMQGLFGNGMALRTVLIWCIFLVNLLNLYLIVYWLPTVLTLSGFSPSEAAFMASMFNAGGVLCVLVFGPLADRFSPQRVLLFVMPCGALFVFIAGFYAMPYAVEIAVTAAIGAAIVGSQHLLNATATLLYPQSIRGTGVGWALGIGRLGGIAGPWLGGVLLADGVAPRQIFQSVCGTALLATAIVFALSRIIPAHGTQRRPTLATGEVVS